MESGLLPLPPPLPLTPHSPPPGSSQSVLQAAPEQPLWPAPHRRQEDAAAQRRWVPAKGTRHLGPDPRGPFVCVVTVHHQRKLGTQWASQLFCLSVCQSASHPVSRSIIHSVSQSFHLPVSPSFKHSCIHLFIHSFILSFIHSFIQSLILCASQSTIHSLIHSVSHSVIHSVIQSVSDLISQSFHQSVSQSVSPFEVECAYTDVHKQPGELLHTYWHNCQLDQDLDKTVLTPPKAPMGTSHGNTPPEVASTPTHVSMSALAPRSSTPRTHSRHTPAWLERRALSLPQTGAL